MDLTFDYTELLRLLIAALLGAMIGLERETHGRYAGLRTNVLVSLGACLLMMISLHMEELFRHLGAESAVRLDPGRIASYGIAGMGFIGAGAIIKGRGSVRGLTTAATLWLLTGIGLAVGAGYVIPAALTTAVTVAILYASRYFSVKKETYTTLVIKFEGSGRRLIQVRDILDQFPGIKITFVSYFMDVKNDTVTYRLFLRTKDDIPFGLITTDLQNIPGVAELAWEAGQVP